MVPRTKPMWIALLLPDDATDFTTLRKFNISITKKYLLKYCKVNF